MPGRSQSFHTERGVPTGSMDVTDTTLRFFLGQVVSNLERELDWRAEGSGRSVVSRALIYLAAMARDLVRIPLHHPEGIAQARFRARLLYIREVALPTLRFFSDEYDLDFTRTGALDEAIMALETAEALVSDGPVRVIDQWYATMDEFNTLTELSRRATSAIRRVIGFDAGESENRGTDMGRL